MWVFRLNVCFYDVFYRSQDFCKGQMPRIEYRILGIRLSRHGTPNIRKSSQAMTTIKTNMTQGKREWV
jgi:hypothetical protein